MRPAVLFPFFAATQCLELACIFFIVYLKISRRLENLIFSLLAFAIGGMIGAELLLQETNSLQMGLLWYRLQFVCGFFCIALILHFISLAVRNPLSRRCLFGLLYPGAALLAACAFSPLVLHLPPAHSPLDDIDRNAPGPLYFPYIALPLAGMVLANLLGWQTLRRRRRGPRAQENSQDFMPVLRSVDWIVSGIFLIVLACIMEFYEVVFVPVGGWDPPINPRAVATTLFCLITAWVLGREVFLTEQKKRQLDTENEFLDALTQFRLQTMRDVQHEVKNGLVGISTPLKVACLGLTQGHETFRLQERLSDALAEAQELDTRMQTMLNTARMEAGLAPCLEPERPTDIRALVETLCDKKARLLMQERQLRIWQGADEAAIPCYQFHLTAFLTHPVIPVHAETLTLILTNLLDNAVKYSPCGGDIAVALQERGGELEIVIADSGLGIAPEDRTRIFDEPFHRGRRAASGIAGTGLGLNMVKRLLEAQGGRIHLTAASEQGSTFTLTVPCARGESPLECVEKVSEKPPRPDHH